MNANLNVKSYSDIEWTGVPIEKLTHEQLLDAFRSVACSYRIIDDAMNRFLARQESIQLAFSAMT